MARPTTTPYGNVESLVEGRCHRLSSLLWFLLYTGCVVAVSSQAVATCLQGLSDVSRFAQGRRTLSSRTEASLLATVDKNRLAASFGMSGMSGVSRMFDVSKLLLLQNIRLLKRFFFSSSSWTVLLKQFFWTIILNTSSASEVDVLWSSARHTLDLSLSARRYLYSWGPYIYTCGNLASSQCWPIGEPELPWVANVNQWGVGLTNVSMHSHVNSPVIHPQNFKRLCMGVESTPMFTGEFWASMLTYQWSIYTDM